MTRFTLATIVAVAFVAVASLASAAVAAPPEFGRCVKLTAPETREYSDAGCTKEVSAAGKFEWLPGPGPKAKFVSKLKEATVATLETVTATKVTCKGESDTGEYSGLKTVADLTVLFTGCESGSLACTSAGQTSGDVATATLEGELGVEKVGSPETKSKIGLLLFASGHGAISEFECAGLPVTVRGSIIHPVPANKMLLTATEKFAATKGEQKPDKFAGEGADAHTLESSVAGGPFEEAGQTLTTVTTNEEKTEVRAGVAKAAECPDLPAESDVALCIEGEEQGSDAGFESTQKAATTSGFTVEAGPTISCTAGVNVGTLNVGGVFSTLHFSGVKITLTECEVANEKAKCEVAEPVEVDGEGKGLESNELETLALAREPRFKSAGKIWTKLVVKAKPGEVCAVAGNFNVTGEQTCTLPAITVEEVTHELQCPAVKSKLESAGKTVTFSLTETFTLNGGNAGKNFSFQKS
jgi:hypothetical protein